MNIPCKDCLCFPICKSQAVMKNSQKGDYVYLAILDDKCDLFSKWYRSYKRFHNAKTEVTECFGTNSSTWFRGWWEQIFK